MPSLLVLKISSAFLSLKYFAVEERFVLIAARASLPAQFQTATRE
ncbi:MAG: hypothetical protein ACI82A_004076 [Candidatus Azotimanducaceae bacterium]|jgi:hypothetical protein